MSMGQAGAHENPELTMVLFSAAFFNCDFAVRATTIHLDDSQDIVEMDMKNIEHFASEVIKLADMCLGRVWQAQGRGMNGVTLEVTRPGHFLDVVRLATTCYDFIPGPVHFRTVNRRHGGVLMCLRGLFGAFFGPTSLGVAA